MNVPALQTIPAQRHPEPTGRQAIGSKADSEAKLRESCRQFEAILWRSVLEKSNSSQSGDETGDAGAGGSCDKTGTYQYFINDTIANSVSGLPSSFSSILFATLAPHLPQETKS